MWRRDWKVKKDIWAAIAFLTTGLLFYLAQVDGAPQQLSSSSEALGSEERIMVEEGAPETSEELPLMFPRIRDS
jgi:hypothetical protein